jgi:hypothetical protein
MALLSKKLLYLFKIFLNLIKPLTFAAVFQQQMVAESSNRNAHAKD